MKSSRRRRPGSLAAAGARDLVVAVLAGLRLGDIAILLPARTSLPMIETCLDHAGIDYRTEASSIVYGTPEIRDLLLAVRAVANTADEASLVGALRSPLFACGDDDLLRWRAGGGVWTPTARIPGDKAFELFNPFDWLKFLLQSGALLRLFARYGKITVAEYAQRFKNPAFREHFAEMMGLEDDYPAAVMIAIAAARRLDCGEPDNLNLDVYSAMPRECG